MSLGRTSNFARPSIAISEYAPDSEVIVNKNKYASRYIILPSKGTLPRYYYYRCANELCGKIHLRNLQISDLKCNICNSDTIESSFLLPHFGFVADAHNKESSILKPKKTYSSEVFYLGSTEPSSDDLNIDEFIVVQKTTEDKLLIVNENPFFYCCECGYAVLEKKYRDLKRFPKEHNNFRRTKCVSVDLEQTKLGQIITTDVIKIKINMQLDYDTALSTLTAITSGITNYLQIDTNDINNILTKVGAGLYTFILYDTTYGVKCQAPNEYRWFT